MFNLEQSIAEWRRQMLAAGIKSPVPLEELEGHLREQIEAQIQSGKSEQLAFETAVGQMGQAGELKNEFGKTGGARSSPPWRTLQMGAIGLVGTVMVNLLGRFVFHRNSSIFLSDEWWSAWFPCYLSWSITIIIGIGIWASRRERTRTAGRYV